ncbi:MAG TPA: stage V sporulation protein AC [Clostridiaceae bacterium]|nr:stage V sporulation protein AC [Clostridiaceae bacterium]
MVQNIMTKKEYQKYAESKSPKSKLFRNIIRAFWVGGMICVLGQLFTNLLKNMGVDMEEAGSITSIIMIFLGILFTGLNVYDELGRYAGAGSTVPITGFANSIVSPAMEFKSEGYIMGVGAKMFVIAGPVLVYGILASVVVGVLYYLIK